MKRGETVKVGSVGTQAAGSPSTFSVVPRPGSMAGMHRSAMQDWLRVYRRLVELEAEFSEVVMRAAAGEISPEELREKHDHLIGMRDLCTTVYAKAFSGNDGYGPACR